MSIISYSQNFEDVMLWRVLGDIRNGFYIDIGAQHPVIDSVSKAFYEHAWRGIHVEATPHYANLLREDRPDEMVLQTALGSGIGSLTFYVIPDTGLSTGDASVADHHRSCGYNVMEIEVPCTTLEEVFGHANREEIHWLKIDVEGMESQVLAGWGKSPARPWVLVIESTYPNSQIKTHHEWENIILDRGYVFTYFDGLSRYYVSSDKTDLIPKFSEPPNIFDGFSIAISSPFNKIARDSIEEQRQKHQVYLEKEVFETARELTIINTSLAQKNTDLIEQLQASEEQLINLSREYHQSNTHLKKQFDVNRQKLNTLNKNWLEFQKIFASEIHKRHKEHEKQKEVISFSQREILKITKEYEICKNSLAAQIIALERHKKAWIQNEKSNETLILSLRADFEKEIISERKTHKKKEEHLEAKFFEQNLLISEACSNLSLQAKNEMESFNASIQEMHDSLSKIQAEAMQNTKPMIWCKNKIKTSLPNLFSNDKKNNAFTGNKNISNHSQTGLAIFDEQKIITQVSKPIKLIMLQNKVNFTDSVGHHSHKYLNLEDEKFVRDAYLKLLNREPDQEGLDYYINKLRNGFSKMTILMQIRSSEESQSLKIQVPEIDKKIKIQKTADLFFLGWLVKKFLNFESDSILNRNVRIIQRQLLAIEQKNTNNFDEITKCINNLLSNAKAIKEEIHLEKSQVDNSPSVEVIENQGSADSDFNYIPPNVKEIYMKLQSACQARKVK